MATKSKSRSKSEARTRKWRTPEAVIADLLAKIEQVKGRAKAKKVKASPSGRYAIAALRNLDRGLEAAAEEGNNALRHALADARKSLGGYLQSTGMKLPQTKLPRGRRPKPA